MAAAVGQVYQTSIAGSGASTISVTPTFSAGDSAYLTLKVPSGTTILSVADSVNGVTGWTLKAGPNTVAAADVYEYIRDNMAAGSPLVTVTFSGSTAFTGLQVTDITGTSGFDTASTAAYNVQTTGATRTSGNSGTPVGTGIAVGFAYNDTNNNAGAVDTGSGWAAATGTGVTAGRFWNFGTGNAFAIVESKAYTTTPLAATFTTFTGSSTASIIALFKDATADVTVSLTGQRATFTPGIMTASGGTTPTVNTSWVQRPGNPALSSPTNMLQFGVFRASPVATSNVTINLVGQAATFSAGLMTPSLAVALTGQSALFTAGVITASSGSDITVALMGQPATFTPGLLHAALALGLTGQAATFTPGTMTNGLSVTLVGQAATFHAGFVTASGGTPPVGGPQVTLVGFIANMGSLMMH